MNQAAFPKRRRGNECKKIVQEYKTGDKKKKNENMVYKRQFDERLTYFNILHHPLMKED